MTGTDINSHPARLGIDDGFSFNCGNELECFNKCCRNINLYLTPYDISRIKRRLEIPSYEFLKIYTIPLFPEEIGHPVILMKMVPDETRNCPFVSEEGCMIYDDRPWSCRSFPLEPIADSNPPEFEIIKRDFCKGFDKGRPHSIKKWRDTQNMAFYEDMNEDWKKLTHNKNFDSRNLLQGSARDIFFIGSYNIDEFRNLVFKGDFLNHFDVEKRVIKKIRTDETELLRFSFRWMRHVLFGEGTLKRK
ncbi:MAG: YkgJ family cysteine cluster protein [Nitrospirota bacterium]